jgi:hypothetical protein
MGIFLETWFCGSCGLEMCGACHAQLPENEEPKHILPCSKIHSKGWLFPVSPFSDEELRATLEEMKSLDLPPCPSPPVDFSNIEINKMHARPIRRFKAADVTDEEFDRLLASAEPFVLTDVITPQPPSELLDLNEADPHHCKTTYFDGTRWCYKDSTLERYFSAWGTQRKEVSILKLPGIEP